jgi:ABC-2 type transport system ATP-binding protein
MIEARGLVKHYRSTLAVDNLSFDVRPGTVTGFLGPNGAGKSTTMRMIMAWTGRTQDRPGSAGRATVTCAGRSATWERCLRLRRSTRAAPRAPT